MGVAKYQLSEIGFDLGIGERAVIEHVASFVQLDQLFVQRAPRQIEIEHGARDRAPLGEADQARVVHVDGAVLGQQTMLVDGELFQQVANRRRLDRVHSFAQT